MQLLQIVVIIEAFLAVFMVINMIRTAILVPEARRMGIIFAVCGSGVLCVVWHMIPILHSWMNGFDHPYVAWVVVAVASAVVLLYTIDFPCVEISSGGKEWIGWWMTPFDTPKLERGQVRYTIHPITTLLFVSGHRTKSYTNEGGNIPLGYHSEATVWFDINVAIDDYTTPGRFIHDINYIDYGMREAVGIALHKITSMDHDPDENAESVFLEELQRLIPFRPMRIPPNLKLNISVRSYKLHQHRTCMWKRAAEKLRIPVYPQHADTNVTQTPIPTNPAITP